MTDWTPGEKHPTTDETVYMNVRGYDMVRRILIARCRVCTQVVSRDEKAVKEIIFDCDDKGCLCKKAYASKAHQVCSLCYDMWHALYWNTGLKNVKYFSQLDEVDAKKRNDDGEGRRRMGI